MSSPASASRVARARLSVMLVSVFSACVGRGSCARSAASSSAAAAAASACAGPARRPSAAGRAAGRARGALVCELLVSP